MKQKCNHWIKFVHHIFLAVYFVSGSSQLFCSCCQPVATPVCPRSAARWHPSIPVSTGCRTGPRIGPGTKGRFGQGSRGSNTVQTCSRSAAEQPTWATEQFGSVSNLQNWTRSESLVRTPWCFLLSPQLWCFTIHSEGALITFEWSLYLQFITVTFT